MIHKNFPPRFRAVKLVYMANSGRFCPFCLLLDGNYLVIWAAFSAMETLKQPGIGSKYSAGKILRTTM